MGCLTIMKQIPPWVWIVAGTVALASLTTVGVNYAMSAWMTSSNAQKWATALSNAEQTYGLPTGLLSRIAYQESRFIQSFIDGTRASSAGALGMMQLMPQFFSTVQRPVPFSDQDTLDQISQAAELLASLYTHFGDWTATVAAYNAGEGTINHVLAGTANLPSETANYIANIAADLPGVVNSTLSA